MFDIPVSLFQGLLMQRGMGHCYVKCLKGNSCGYCTSSGRLVHRLFRAAARFEIERQKSPSPCQTGKGFAWRQCSLPGSTSTIHLKAFMFIALGTFCSCQFVDPKHSPSQDAKSLGEALLRVFCCLLLKVFLWTLLTNPMLTTAACSAYV